MDWPCGKNARRKNSQTHTKGKTEGRWSVGKPRKRWEDFIDEISKSLLRLANWRMRCLGTEKTGGLKFRRPRSDSDCCASDDDDEHNYFILPAFYKTLFFCKIYKL